MIKARWLIVLGAASFLASLLLNAPIATLHAWVTPEASTVQLLGLQGTLAGGQASRVLVQGRSAVESLRWDLHPLSLLLLRASADLETTGTLSLKGRTSISPTGSVTLRAVRAAGDIKALLTEAGFGYLPVSGQAGLDVDRLELDDGFPEEVEGVLELRDVSWTLGKAPLRLGDFRAELSSDDEAHVAALSSPTGPLDVAGQARLFRDRRYELDLQMKPKPEAAPQLVNFLQTLGAPDRSGFYHLRRQGQLAEPQPPPAPPG